MIVLGEVALWAFAAVVLARVVCMAARLDARSFDGHPWRFAGVAAAYAALGAGALAVALQHPLGGALLLAGCAGWVLFDRRRLA